MELTRRDPIVVKQFFNTSTVNVWKAITEVGQMKQWFFPNINEFEPVEGFSTEFNVETPDKNFLHKWKIIEVIPERKIVYDWSYEEYPGQGIVTFRLKDVDDGCMLELTNTGLHTFPDNMPEFTRESCKNGWKYFIQEQLLSHIEGK